MSQYRNNDLLAKFASVLLTEVRSGKDPVETAKGIAEKYRMKLPIATTFEDLMATAANMARWQEQEASEGIKITNPLIDQAMKDCQKEFDYVNKKFSDLHSQLSEQVGHRVLNLIAHGRRHINAASNTSDAAIALANIMRAQSCFGVALGVME